MTINPTTVPDLAYIVAGTAVLSATAGYLARRPKRPRRTTTPPPGRTSRRGEDLLTFGVAALATAVAAQGMWKFFGDVLHFPALLRIGLFAFLELAMFTSAVRARRNVHEFGRAGIDGIAVWIGAALSAVFSALDAASMAEALFRLIAPLVAAWLWERGMSIERRRRLGRARINWRITPERLLVRLGIAEAADRTASDVDAHRRLTLVARRAKQVRTLKATDAWKWRIRRATARLDRAMDAAVEHAALAADPDRQASLLAQLGALYHAAALADLTPDAPWAALADPTPEPEHPAIPTGHDLSDEQLVELGYDAARVQRWLADRGVAVEQREVSRLLADAPRPPAVTARVAPVVPPVSSWGDRPATAPEQPDAATASNHPNDQPGDRSPDGQPPGPAKPNDRAAERPATARPATRPAARSASRSTGQAKTGHGDPRSLKSDRPTPEENAKAVDRYRQSVKAGRPLSQRDLAKEFGRSPGWARDRIREAGLRPVGGTEQPADDRSPVTTRATG